MKYSIDEIEDHIIKAENLETKEQILLSKELLPKDIKEGSIIEETKDGFKQNNELEDERRTTIDNLFESLKKGTN